MRATRVLRLRARQEGNDSSARLRCSGDGVALWRTVHHLFFHIESRGKVQAMIPKRTIFLVLVCCLITAATGCPRAPKNEQQEAETFINYAKLPGLQAAHHPELKVEYALLVSERMTPAMLDEDAVKAAAGVTDLRQVLAAQFNSSALEYAMERTGRQFENGELNWNEVSMLQASQVLRQYDSQRTTVREALSDPDTTMTVPLSQGLGVNIDFIDAAQLYHRLETFYAADQMARGDLDGTLETLGLMFRLSALLGEQKHVVARLTAARCRSEALNIVDALAKNSKTTNEQWDRLASVVNLQLANWPNDAKAWIGDRAQGLHMYEMIRDGHLLSMLTSEELQELSEGRTLNAFQAAAVQTIDDDEAFYLQAMRKLIEDCDVPYYQRRDTFAQLRDELGELQKSPEYPLIADRLLLQEVEMAQEQQALDRAWMEAWANALALAVEDVSPPYKTNPATGSKYDINYENGRVIVSRIDPADYKSRVVAPLNRTRNAAADVALPPLR